MSDVSGPTSFANDKCEGQWWLLHVGSIKVGEKTSAEVVKFATVPAQAVECESRVTAVVVTASVAGIVSVAPGDGPRRVVLTGLAPGETALAAEITLRDGSKRTDSHGSPIVVTP